MLQEEQDRSDGVRVSRAQVRRAPIWGLGLDLLRAAWEELRRPRVRVRATLRRAVRRMRGRPRAAALFWGGLAGVVFILYAYGAGVGRGLLAWGVFTGTATLFAVGGPLALVYAWPVAVAAFLGGSVWAGIALGPGALWLAAATCAAVMSMYFAASELAPLLGAAALAWFAWSSAGQWGGRFALAAAAFVAGAVVLLVLRRKATAPILLGGWVMVSCAAAARVGWLVSDGAVQVGWSMSAVPGPPGLVACATAAAACAGLLAWPRRRADA